MIPALPKSSTPPGKAASLTTVFTIPQVAKMAGWSRSRMTRHLCALNRELGGMLLRNVSRGTQKPRWTVTLAALQSVAPQWFHDPESLQRQLDDQAEQIADLKAQVRNLTAVSEMQTERIVALARTGS